jgi:hypothetical protein
MQLWQVLAVFGHLGRSHARMVNGICTLGHTQTYKLALKAALGIVARPSGRRKLRAVLVPFLFNDWTMDRFGAGHGLIPAVWKLAIVIPASVLIHVYVERPGRNIILQWWNRRSASNATA